jgi:hypothetical protein
VLYIQRKEQEHIDGIVVTPKALMDLVLKQYQMLKYTHHTNLHNSVLRYLILHESHHVHKHVKENSQ